MRCDIIIPVWNQLSYTQDCIESIICGTGDDYRLIVVDNASGDETRRYLEGLRSNVDLPLVLIRNEENAGFIKAVNQAIAVSDAPYVCVLNNDTIVTKGWLEEMIAVAESSKEIGLVNPSSNNLGQKPASGEPIELYADKIRDRSGTCVELGAAIGFCMLIKRELIKKIGVFDEIYGMGNFEDTDFSRRAVKEGYRCVRACGAYVYHRENTSFGKVRTFNEDFQRNREIFEFRWGRPKRVAYVIDLCDANVLKRLGSESLRLAREGNWVHVFMKERLDIPTHSNIVVAELPARCFYAHAAFRILKKKKRFSDIYVGEEAFGRVLDALAFLHKAKVRYY